MSKVKQEKILPKGPFFETSVKNYYWKHYNDFWLKCLDLVL
jgi:hypothetical protein